MEVEYKTWVIIARCLIILVIPISIIFGIVYFLGRVGIFLVAVYFILTALKRVNTKLIKKE